MKPRARSISAAAVVAAGLLLVFWAYLNPHLALELTNEVWGCF